MKLIVSLLLALSLAAQAAEHPNVVIIYGDDIGYGDVGVNGSKLIPTPNLDKLAAEGLNFTDGHCSAATCSPSRFSLLTGVHGFRHGVRILAPNAPLSIPTDKLTLPGLFRKAGYETAVVGKWHLGIGDGSTDWNGEVKPGPLEIGFDYSFLLPSTNDRVPCVYLENHRVVNLDPADPLYVGKAPEGFSGTRYSTDRKDMTYYESSHGHDTCIINGIGRIGMQYGGKAALWDDETMADEFVKQSRKWISARSEAKPFFLFFSSQDIHVPRTPHPRFIGKTTLGHRGDAMVAFDWAAGEVLKSLEENGFTENTIVIFSSDNGPVYDDGYKDGTVVKTSMEEVDQGHDGSGPYRGGKYQIYEGGTRVPFMVKWPGRVKPGATTGALFNQIDLIASFAELLGIDLAADEAIDSRNNLAAFLGEDAVGLPYMLEEARGLALRRADWKYIAPGRKSKTTGKVAKGELYELKSDVGEQKNVIAKHPEVAGEMHALLEKLRDATAGIRAETP